MTQKTIEQEVKSDLAHKFQTKMEDTHYIEDNGYDVLSEKEREEACFKDAQEDLVEALQDRSKSNLVPGEFSNLYYGAYREKGGAVACRKAAELAASLTLSDLVGAA